MTNHERRSAVALDDALNYCRHLDAGTGQPDLFKLCNAIATLDTALAGHELSPIPVSLCVEAWSRVRDSLFDALVSRFAGHFEVFDETNSPVYAGCEWPERGRLEFFPAQMSRRNDSCEARLERISHSVLTALRWAFAEGRQDVTPPDFCAEPEVADEEETAQARELLERLYSVCEEQAHELKKKAHRKWWQLYWEANSCPNKRQKHELRKQMVALEGMWGRPNGE